MCRIRIAKRGLYDHEHAHFGHSTHGNWFFLDASRYESPRLYGARQWSDTVAIRGGPNSIDRAGAASGFAPASAAYRVS